MNVEPLLLSRTIADNQSAQIGPPDADVRTEHVNIVIIDSSLNFPAVIKLSSDRKSFFLEICCQKNLPLVINDGPATLRLYVRCFGTEEKKNRLWRERLNCSCWLVRIKRSFIVRQGLSGDGSADAINLPRYSIGGQSKTLGERLRIQQAKMVHRRAKTSMRRLHTETITHANTNRNRSRQ